MLTTTLVFNCGCKLVLTEEEDGRYFCSYKRSECCSKYHKYLMFELFPFYLRYVGKENEILKRTPSTERYLDFFTKSIHNLTGKMIGKDTEIDLDMDLDSLFVQVVTEHVEQRRKELESKSNVVYETYYGNHFPPFEYRFKHWLDISKKYDIPELESLHTSLVLLLPTDMFSKSEYETEYGYVPKFIFDIYKHSSERFCKEVLSDNTTVLNNTKTTSTT